MKIFDFAGQTLLLLAALAMIPFEKYGLTMIALVQFFMGIWQLLSATITTASRDHGDIIRTKMIRIYWIWVIIYFAGLIALELLMKENIVIIKCNDKIQCGCTVF